MIDGRCAAHSPDGEPAELELVKGLLTLRLNVPHDGHKYGARDSHALGMHLRRP